MSQPALKKPALDPNALESEIQRRLQRGKIKLLISQILLFLLVVSTFLFATSTEF